MSHDVYICYDEREKEISDAVYRIFEENNIKPWIKSRDFSSDDSVDKITNAIADSKCFILILSKISKDTNYVITETDLAFSRNVPILVFNLDDLKISGNLEFILETQRKIPSFPNPKKQLETLVRESSKIIGNPIDKVKVNSGSVGVIDRINPKRKDNILKKVIMAAVPIAVILILVYFFLIVPMGQNTSADGMFSMNITDVEISPSSDLFKYTVFGESYNLPGDSQNYLMNLRFFDENEDMVFEVNSTADEFKSGIIWSGDLKEDNVTHIGFRLFDLNNNVLSQEDYKIA